MKVIGTSVLVVSALAGFLTASYAIGHTVVGDGAGTILATMFGIFALVYASVFVAMTVFVFPMFADPMRSLHRRLWREPTP